MNKISNPLTIVGIFAGIAEVAGTIVLPFVDVSLQVYFIWYVMGFPIFLVIVFFITLNVNPKVLYAPSDYSDENNFMKLLTNAKETLDKTQVTIDKLQTVIEPLVLSTLHNITYMGRYGAGGNTSEKDRIRDCCVDIVEDLGIKMEDIDNALSQYNTYNKWDAFSLIEHTLRYTKHFDELKTREIINSLTIENRYKDRNFPSFEFIISIFDKNGISEIEIPHDVKRAIDNYVYRLQYNKSLYELDIE